MNGSEILEGEAKRRFCLAVAARAKGGANGAAHRKDIPQDPNDEPVGELLERIKVLDRKVERLGLKSSRGRDATEGRRVATSL
jgi:hypothetical protein